MSIFFTFIYRALKRNKILFLLLLTLSVGFCAYFAPKIKFEEDITRMMPNDAKTEHINKLLKNFEQIQHVMKGMKGKGLMKMMSLFKNK